MLLNPDYANGLAPTSVRALAERGSRLARNTSESCAISGFARRADCFGEKVLLFPAESFVHFFAILPVVFAFVQSVGKGISLDRS